MLKSQSLQIEQSTKRQRINELLGKDELSAEERAELDPLTKRAQEIEVEYRAAVVAEDADLEQRKSEAGEGDAEQRERAELRSKSLLTNYVTAILEGREVKGAEAELRSAAGIRGAGIPIEIFDVPAPERRGRAEERADAPSASPSSGTGVNLHPLFPSIFARSVVPRMGVAMPRAPSGTFATGTVTTDLTAGAKAKGTAQESTAAVVTTKTTQAHRVSARLSLQIEDIVTIGVGNFESILRQNVSLALSSQLDILGLTGDGQNANPQGLLSQLTDPTDPTAVVDFDGFVSLVAGGIDGGPWAEDMTAVRVLVNAEAMRKAETTFQTATNYKGENSSASYLRANSGGFMSSSRMPATVSTIAQSLRYRAGTMGLDGVNAMTTALCPVFGELAIDDIYTSSASGTRHFTMHTLIGDVLIVQADAYERVDLKLA